MSRKEAPRAKLWNPDTVYELGLCRILAQILGIWPVSCQDTFSKIRFVVVAILEISMMINLIREMLAECVVIGEMVNFVALVGCSVIACLKVTLLRINRERMERVIVSAVEDWAELEDSKEREIMKKHAKTGRFVFIFQMGSALITIVPLTLASLPFLFTLPTSGEERLENSSFRDASNVSSYSSALLTPHGIPQRGLPMGTGCFVADASLPFYALVYLLQIIQLVTTCAGNVGTDVYFFVIAMHVCGQFELLGRRFQNFGDNLDVRECRSEIGRLVRRHNHLLKLSNSFEDTFNVLILAQLSVNALHMSLLGIQLLLCVQSGNGVTAIGALIAFYILSLQIFFYSYAGDYLTTQIEKMRHAIYCARWYDLSPKVTKDLTFVMIRSQRTFNLTAGKVFSINMDNFKNIFKAMGSYFSVLKIIFDA